MCINPLLIEKRRCGEWVASYDSSLPTSSHHLVKRIFNLSEEQVRLLVIEKSFSVHLQVETLLEKRTISNVHGVHEVGPVLPSFLNITASVKGLLSSKNHAGGY